MHGSRPERVGDQIRGELSELLAREVKDPGIGFLTVTHVKVSPDLQVARVYYTVLGDEAQRKQSAKALQRAAPFLRRQIAGRLQLRRAPELAFTYDVSIERGERLERLMQDLRTEHTDDSTTGSTPPARDRGDA
ncbi:MAG: 30S ribosome-binding factor RbfA [Vicinamibacterales bacterium]